MARINIEDSIYKDFRFTQLLIKLGSIDAAIGSLVRAWTLAQTFYTNLETDRLIPVSEWRRQQINSSIIDVGLAEVRGEFIYVCGTEKHNAWLLQRVEAGKKGGRPSKRNKEVPTKPTAFPRLTEESGSNPLTLSLSLTHSLTQEYIYPSSANANASPQTDTKNLSLVKERVLKWTPSAEELEEIYRTYPLKKGKLDGLKKAAKDIKSPEDLAKLKQAIDKYKADIAKNGTEQKYIKYFSTFMSSWREWLDPETGTALRIAKTYDWSFLNKSEGEQ